jgi:hypothetical protein
MALPRRFEIVVTAPVSQAVRQQTGANVAGDVSTLETETSGAMEATNVAVIGCTALALGDAQAWATIYGAWQTFDQDLQGCLANVPAGQYAPPTVTCWMAYGMNWASAITKLKSYQSQAQAWQARVHAACPSYNPLPVVVNPQQPPAPAGAGWWCNNLGWGCGGATPAGSSSVGWPDAIKWGAILGIIAVAAWYIGPLIATVAGVGAGAIRKRASGRDEFEPVEMFKRGADANLSFGNTAIESPRLEPLQFGDVPRDEILSLIRGED